MILTILSYGLFLLWMEGITMPKSKKLTAVYALIMDLPLSIVVTMVALALGGNLTMERFIPSFCLVMYLHFLLIFYLLV